ncbi:MAG: serine/threonine protein kinase, partial [Mogibacterium sp.]|nr:serine/threonine protein kinase [Mogibacterium sp.]
MTKTWRDWNIMEELGAGSYGRVYRIERTDEFGYTEESALKVLRIPQGPDEYWAIRNEGMSEEDATAYFREIAESLNREVTLMSRLKGHSNIVSYEDREVRRLDDGYSWMIYIRMELLEPMTKWLRENPVQESDVLRVGMDLCQAIEFCRTHNVLHRDIKPENIFYAPNQQSFKLGDFGIARKFDQTTNATGKRGTISFMAPEVYLGRPYNATVDIYSLGIVLYKLLNNNRTPFLPPYPERIRYNDSIEANNRRMNGEPFPPPCNADPELAAIVLRACAFDAAERYQTASELREALFCYKQKLNAGGKILSVAESAEESEQKSSKVEAPDEEGDNKTVVPEDLGEDNEQTVVLQEQPLQPLP